MEGHTLIAAEAMEAKIRAAAASKMDKDFVLIARTDGISAEGFDAEIQRINRYKQAGADVVFLDAPRSMEQLEKIPKLVEGPILINVVRKIQDLHFKKFEELGYALAIYPAICLSAGVVAIREKLIELKEKGFFAEWTDGKITFHDLILEILKLKEYRGLEEKFLMKG